MSLHDDFGNQDWIEEGEDNTTNTKFDEDKVDMWPPKKLLTKKWFLHDIDTALDENNYEDLPFVNGDEKCVTLNNYLGPIKDKNTKNTT